MSAGSFSLSKYTDDSGIVRPIRVQPETITLNINGASNSAPTADPDPAATAVRVSGGRNAYGIKARSVRIKFTGTPPAGYLEGSVISLPWLIPGTFATVRRPLGQTGTYLGAAVQVVGSSSEAGRG